MNLNLDDPADLLPVLYSFRVLSLQSDLRTLFGPKIPLYLPLFSHDSLRRASM